MAFKLPDGVKQQSNATTTTGNVSLDLVVTGAKQFNEEFSNGDTTIVVRRDSTDHEVFYATYNSGNDDLSYVGSPIASTNNGDRVNWNSTPQDVFVAPSGSKLLLRDSNGNTFDGEGNSIAKEPSVSLGTQTSGTLTADPASGLLQALTDGGAFTLSAPSSEGIFVIVVTNNASAGAITFSGFDEELGDSHDTTNGNVFEFIIVVVGSRKSVQIRADSGNT